MPLSTRLLTATSSAPRGALEKWNLNDVQKDRVEDKDTADEIAHRGWWGSILWKWTRRCASIIRGRGGGRCPASRCSITLRSCSLKRFGDKWVWHQCQWRGHWNGDEDKASVNNKTIHIYKNLLFSMCLLESDWLKQSDLCTIDSFGLLPRHKSFQQVFFFFDHDYLWCHKINVNNWTTCSVILRK